MRVPIITPVAESVPFDNDTNGFVAENVQDAIEEVQAGSLPGFVIDNDLCFIFTNTGGFVFP